MLHTPQVHPEDAGQLPVNPWKDAYKGCFTLGETGNHPELDSSDLLDFGKIGIYQSLIGDLQWVIQIGQFDVVTAVMTMSRFQVAPQKGHMERVQRIHGYISKMRHGVICIRTEEPDYSSTPVKHHD